MKIKSKSEDQYNFPINSKVIKTHRMLAEQTPSQTSIKREKSKQQYSRNVKKLKYKLSLIQQQIHSYTQKLQRLSSTSNDQLIAMKINKFCKDRRFTPEMIFRFADRKGSNVVSREQWRQTLVSIGLSTFMYKLELSQQELTRLEYLLDEDIKGDISLLEWSKYLHSFGLKAEHDPNDPFVQDTLKNLDFNKMLEIAKDTEKDNKKKKTQHLLTYEEFLKYCHKHFQGMFKDYELSNIFNKLQRDNLIDLADFIDYINDLNEQKRKQDQKNKRKQEEKQKKKQREEEDEAQNNFKEEEQAIDFRTLKGQLMAVLKDHPREQQNFHCSQFKRVGKSKEYLQQSKTYEDDQSKLPPAQRQLAFSQMMVRLFKQMDQNARGSLNYNDIIKFYVEKETYKPNNNQMIKYSFILMGKKIMSRGEKPETFVDAYAKNDNYITREEFRTLGEKEYELKKESIDKLFEVVLTCQNGQVPKDTASNAVLISLMKVPRKGTKNAFRPAVPQKMKQFLYKKQYQTICTNGILAFKLCYSLAQQLTEAGKSSGKTRNIQKWDDFEFGPTPDDDLGADSLGGSFNESEVKWIRASDLRMKDWYLPTSKEEKIFFNGPKCENDLFSKALEFVVRNVTNCMNVPQTEIIKHEPKISDSELSKVFQGLYPLIFHQFKDWGIYVVQFYIRSKYVYVIIDEKIPCSIQNQKLKPMFSRSSNKTSSYVSLVEKAYAKLRGGYDKMWEGSSLAKYVHEMTGFLPYGFGIENKETAEEQKTQWLSLLPKINKGVRKQQLKKMKQNKLSYNIPYLANLSMIERKPCYDDKSGLERDVLLPIYFALEPNKESKLLVNLMLTKYEYIQSEEDKKNKKEKPGWILQSQNWLTTYSGQIQTEIIEFQKGNDAMRVSQKDRVVLEQERINQMFNTLLVMRKVIWEQNLVVLRKQVKFQENFSCIYKINSKDKNKSTNLVILLNKIRGPLDAKIIIKKKCIQQVSKEQPQLQKTITSFRSQFICTSLQIPYQEHEIEIKVQKFQSNTQYIYQLSFYFQNSNYALKERDRQLLFRNVSKQQEKSKLQFDWLSDAEKKLFYDKFFHAAGRKGTCCC